MGGGGGGDFINPRTTGNSVLDLNPFQHIKCDILCGTLPK